MPADLEETEARTPGNELAVIAPAQVVAAIVDGTKLPEVESSEDTARAILTQILGADDVDAIYSTYESTSAKELLDQPLEVHGVKWRPSAFDEGAPVFAIIDATILTSGERVTVTCSGRSVMAGLYRMAELEAFPQQLRIREAKKASAAGYKPLQLARA